MFNEGQYWRRAQQAELSALRTRPKVGREPPAVPERGYSEFWEYREGDGTIVARVHLKRLPDGGIGGQGLPDPKWLLIGTEGWYSPVEHSDDVRCPTCAPYWRRRNPGQAEPAESV